MINQILCNSLKEVEYYINNQILPLSHYVFRGLPDSKYALISSVEQKIKDKQNAVDCVKRMSQQLKKDLILHNMKSHVYTESFDYPTQN